MAWLLRSSNNWNCYRKVNVFKDPEFGSFSMLSGLIFVDIVFVYVPVGQLFPCSFVFVRETGFRVRLLQ